MTTLDYAKNETPADYVCHQCGLASHKLWLPLSAICGPQTSLLCANCTGVAADMNIDDMRPDGSRPRPDGQGMTVMIGDYFPAVPLPDCSTYWDAASIPSEGIKWWERLAL